MPDRAELNLNTQKPKPAGDAGAGASGAATGRAGGAAAAAGQGSGETPKPSKPEAGAGPKKPQSSTSGGDKQVKETLGEKYEKSKNRFWDQIYKVNHEYSGDNPELYKKVMQVTNTAVAFAVAMASIALGGN